MRRLAPLATVAGFAALAGPTGGGTGFRRPFDVSGRRRFRDAGSYRERYRNGERVTFTVLQA